MLLWWLGASVVAPAGTITPAGGGGSPSFRTWPFKKRSHYEDGQPVIESDAQVEASPPPVVPPPRKRRVKSPVPPDEANPFAGIPIAVPPEIADPTAGIRDTLERMAREARQQELEDEEAIIMLLESL